MEFAVDAAWQAGKITLEYFQTGIVPDVKADASPVTVADRRAEEHLRRLIEARFPDHAVLGEEYGETGPAGASHRWILDPIDGTASFVRGVPLYGVMVALEVDGDASVGALNFPALGEIVYGARGEGAHWNGRRARVSATADLAGALALATDAASMERHGRADAYARICAASKMQRTWGDCYGHALVATGRAEVMLDAVMNVWDCAAIVPIVEEAGGTFTTWSGERTHTGGEAISTNGAVLDELLGLIRE